MDGAVFKLCGRRYRAAGEARHGERESTEEPAQPALEKRAADDEPACQGTNRGADWVVSQECVHLERKTRNEEFLIRTSLPSIGWLAALVEIVVSAYIALRIMQRYKQRKS